MSKHDGLFMIGGKAERKAADLEHQSGHASQSDLVGSTMAADAAAITEIPRAGRPTVVVGGSSIAQIDRAGFAVKPRVFIGGLPEGEYRRQQAIPRRPLTAPDMPGEQWRDGYSKFLLRDDGVIVAQGSELPIGDLGDDGTVRWTRV
ncbi:hypothetical protein [Pandoraea communis]|uniref:hypothetical protein n=1 Tax=Pandoraea communis TaxID=2508297 RepID=UPI0025A4F36C|nr:hypothetical protein [Pandoraea communis]MDM8356566.1 hypothetical protein [Pandoraea communis]